MLFLSCKVNARVKLAKTGHGPHSSTLVVICVVRLLFVLIYVLFVCKYILPPGDNPIAVNKYINIKKKPQGRSAAGRIMSMKNSNDNIGNRTRDLPACNAVPQPTAPPAACLTKVLGFILNLVRC